MSDSTSTGIKAADDFARIASEAGLLVEISRSEQPVTYYADGQVMLPAQITVGMTIKVPVPGELQGTTIGQMCQLRQISVVWSRFVGPGKHGKFRNACRYGYLGVVELTNERQARIELQALVTNIKQLRSTQRKLAGVRAFN